MSYNSCCHSSNKDYGHSIIKDSNLILGLDGVIHSDVDVMLGKKKERRHAFFQKLVPNKENQGS